MPSPLKAATIAWDGNNASNTAWISTVNWNPDDTGRTGGAPTAADIAEFAGVGSGTAIGINFNGTTNNGTNAQIVGQILQSGGFNRTIGNSSTTIGGTLTIAGVGGTLISNTSSNTLTLAPNTAGSFNMQVQFQTAGNINVSGSGITTISAAIAGSNGFVKTGSGRLDLTATNTHTGVTTLREGTLRIANGAGALGALPASPTTTVVLEAGTLLVDTSAGSGANRGFAIGPSTGTGTATIEVVTGRSWGISGVIANNGTSTSSLTKTGDGTLTLSGNNTYTGGTSVLAGTLSVDSGTSMGAAPASPTPGYLTINGGTLASTNTFTLSSNRGISIGPSSGSGSGTIAPASTTTLAYGGIIANNGSGTGSLTVGDTGTLVLTGTNTYTGGTTVNGGGALQVGNGGIGTTGPGVLTVATGSTIFGSGTVRGSAATTHSIAGTMRPGDRPSGTTPLANLNVEGYLVFTPVSSSFFEIGNPASAYDKITGTVGGTSVTLDGTIKVDFSSYTPVAGDLWNLLSWSTIIGSSFNPGVGLRSGANGVDEGDFDLPDLTTLSLQWNVGSFLSNGTISVQAIPEPTRCLMTVMGFVAIALRRRRR